MQDDDQEVRTRFALHCCVPVSRFPMNNLVLIGLVVMLMVSEFDLKLKEKIRTKEEEATKREQKVRKREERSVPF